MRQILFHEPHRSIIHMKKIKPFIIFITAALVFVDLLTKAMAAASLKFQDFVIIKNVLVLHYLENKGAAFSMLSGKGFVFLIVTPIIMAIIIYFIIKLPDERKFFALHFDLAVLLAGALGNFIDRVFLGYVRDFIYFEIIDFPVFNFADICVTLSVIYLFILILFKYKDVDIMKAVHANKS